MLKQALWAIENNKLEYFSEQLNEAVENLHKRKGLVRIAESSSGGWETVRQYESNPATTESENESKIYKVEKQDLKKKKSSRSKRSTRTSTSSTSAFPHVWDQTTTQLGNSQPFNRGRLFRGRNNPYSSSNVGNYGAAQVLALSVESSTISIKTALTSESQPLKENNPGLL